MSEIHDIQSDIGSDWRSIQAEWRDVRHEWRDGLADRFEKEYWDDLENEIPRLLGMLADMDNALEQAQHTIEEN